MKSFIQRFAVLAMAVVIALSGMDAVAGKGSSGSRSSSSRSSSIGGSSRSFSKPSAPAPKPAAPRPVSPSRNTAPSGSTIGGSKSPSSAPAPKPAANTSRNDSASKPSIGGSKPSASAPISTAPKLSPADMAMAKSVKQQGAVRQTRSDAAKAYVASNPKLATPEGKVSTFNSFKSEPSSRPSYIPQSTNVNGRPVNITYYSGYGGYGYMDPLTNTFVNAMMISAIADSAMDYNMAMSGYRYRGDPFNPVVVHHSPMSFWGFLGLVVTLLFIVGIIAIFVRASSNE